MTVGVRRLADFPAVTALPLDVLATARDQFLDRGVGLTELQALECLHLPAERVPAILAELGMPISALTRTF